MLESRGQEVVVVREKHRMAEVFRSIGRLREDVVD